MTGTESERSPSLPVLHCTIDVDGVETLYRDAGPADGPVLLLPHGYLASSFQYRHFMPTLGRRNGHPMRLPCLRLTTDDAVVAEVGNQARSPGRPRVPAAPCRTP